MQVVVDNLILVLQEAVAALEQLPEHLLEEIEAALRARNPRATASPQASVSGSAPLHQPAGAEPLLTPQGSQEGRVFLHEREINDALTRARLVWSLRKGLTLSKKKRPCSFSETESNDAIARAGLL